MSEHKNIIDESEVIQEFKPSTFAIKNSTSVFILAFIIFIAGIISYNTMPKESFPEIKTPTIFISTVYAGNAPLDIENLITRPIEKEVNTIAGLKKLSSNSLQDYSIIIAEFDFDMDVRDVMQKVKDAVERSKNDLPKDLDQDPQVLELDFSEFPIMNVNLYGDRFSMDEMKEYGEYLEDKIEELPQISKVDIRGLQDREVKIEVDPYKLEAMTLSFNDIEGAINAENLTVSAGEMVTDGFRRNIRIIGEYKKISDIENLIIKYNNNEVVYLKDVATVKFDFEDRKSYARMDSKPVITLDVKKKSGENIISAAEGITKIIAEAKKDKLPKDLQVKITGDQSVQTVDMVDNLENNIISAVILCVLVILFFLGLRNSLFVGIAIPLAMILGIIVLNMMGVTLNIMVLFSLVLALGMFIDNAIVVVENIYRMYSEGKPLEKACIDGVSEMAIPIISSTATNIVAFIPLLFWKDIMGEFMKYLPITLMIVLVSSLFVAFIITPAICSVYMKLDDESGKVYNNKKYWRSIIVFAIITLFIYGISFISKGENPGLNGMGSLLLIITLLIVINRYFFEPASFWFRTNLLVKVENGYHRLISWALRKRNPQKIFIGTVVLLIASMMFFAMRQPDVVFFPSGDPQYVNVFVELPIGTDIEVTNELAVQLEKKIENAIAPLAQSVEAVLAQVGEGTEDPQESGSTGGGNSVSPHKARITVSFVPFVQRGGISTKRVMEEIRYAVKNTVGAKITVAQNPSGPPVGYPINIEVSGEDYQRLILLTEKIKKFLETKNVAGVEKLRSNLETGLPELIVDIDRDACRRYGMSTGMVAMYLRTGVFGKEVSQYKIDEEEYPIQLRYSTNYRYNLTSLLNQKITFQNPMTGQFMQVPLSAIADVHYSSTFGSVKRIDMKRVITIYSNVTEGYVANDIVAEYKEYLEGFPLPEGFHITFTGEQESQGESTSFLANAMMIACFLVFLILVAQFNSIISPFIIMFSVIFSIIGVLLGLALFKMQLVILMMGIGMISLAGVVVNNAIVMIDYTTLLRERRRQELGLHRNALLPYEDMIETIVESGRTRLRPVLLTAITNVLGLIPTVMALNINFVRLLTHGDPQIYFGGDSASFWGPLSWIVIFGLSFATFLTLVVVPVMFHLKDKIELKIEQWRR
ncbi:MAG: efflux RND transporter permease subunit [Chitinophagales bacterium]|nr:efflux RND transporter permease subunit [Chitinophagales bacterium]